MKLFFARGREDQVPPTPEPSEGNLSPSPSENDLLDDQDLDDGSDSGDEDCIYETSESSVV